MNYLPGMEPQSPVYVVIKDGKGVAAFPSKQQAYYHCASIGGDAVRPETVGGEG